MKRRNFIKHSLAVSAGFVGLSQFLAHRKAAAAVPMYPTVDNWLELPQNFQAKLISRWGEKMSDGFLVPGRGDGMAAFDIAGKVVIIRNHENSPGQPKYGAFGENMELFGRIDKKNLYDYGFGKTPGLGGTTTLIFNEETQVVEEQFLTLAGTNRNCAGGATPWNSWISCEEDITQKGEAAETHHGYNFEIQAANKALVVPVPLKDMGRFNHEAICIDPVTGIVYQTEDRQDSLIYRFIPHVPGKLHEGGVLQALAIRAQRGFDTRNWSTTSLQVGEALDVEWISLTHVDAETDDLRLRGYAQGAAVFARGEGMWFGKNEVYFACTNGGKNKSGQVFKYVPAAREGTSDEKINPGKLILFAEPNNTDILKYCDNLTVAPWGDIIFVEDNNKAHLRGITPGGKIYTIGRNIATTSELAGVCFSPSGRTLFVNVQDQGMTFAITGPWHQLAR